MPKPSWPATNRRRYQRIPLDSSVIVVSAGEVSNLLARDLGAEGMYVHAPAAPRLGSQVHVEFDLRQEHYSLTGTVIRDETDSGAGPPGFAVRFEVTNEVTEQLRMAVLDATA